MRGKKRSNPLIQSDDVPIVVDVEIAWFGERFFFDNGDLGFTLANNEYAPSTGTGSLPIDNRQTCFGRFL